MGNSDFVSIKLKDRSTTIKMQKGCSFENNGNIYLVDDKGSLNIFNKESKSWTKGKEIEMRDYQLNIFKAVADNSKEVVKGKELKGIVLSKKDIEKAIELHKKGQITDDLDNYVGDKYEIKANRYTSQHAVSAGVTNVANSKIGANLIFKFGNKKDAVKLSEEVNKTQNIGSTSAIESDNKVESSKPPKKTTKTNSPNSNSKKLPEFYQIKIKNVAKAMNTSLEEVQRQIKRAAKETGYSEYFISHLVACEDYEPVVRDTGDTTCTGGFGHSKKKDSSIEIGDRVKPDQAFNWLINDIKDFEKTVKKLKINKKETYGDYFDKLPLSMKEGLIDVAFNRDARKLQNDKEYASLRTNIQKGKEYYPAAAVRVRQKFDYTINQAMKHNFTTGLMERNVYRFLLAVRDFKPEEIAAAKRRFANDGYYDMALTLKERKGYKRDANLMRDAWNNMG